MDTPTAFPVFTAISGSALTLLIKCLRPFITFDGAQTVGRKTSWAKDVWARVARCPVFDRTVRFFGDLSGQKYDAKPDN